MADLNQTLQNREDERHNEALHKYLECAAQLDLPASCHRVLNAIMIETIQKRRKETDELSKTDLLRLTKLTIPTQDRAIAQLKNAGWISSRRIANGGAAFTVTLPGKSSLFDFAGPKGRSINRSKKLRKLSKPQK